VPRLTLDGSAWVNARIAADPDASPESVPFTDWGRRDATDSRYGAECWCWVPDSGTFSAVEWPRGPSPVEPASIHPRVATAWVARLVRDSTIGGVSPSTGGVPCAEDWDAIESSKTDDKERV
jgi:hypothetical protein